VLATALSWAATPPVHAEDAVRIPHFRDPSVRSVKPDLGQRRVLRFLTSADWPPFQFVAADGTPAGFHVDLARAICAQLGLTCTIQAVKWEELEEALNNGRADALIAGMRISPELRKRFELTNVYMRLPARFAVRRASPLSDVTVDSLRGKRVGVVGSTAQEAYLKAFFTGAELVPYAGAEEARAALKGGTVDALFADGVSLSLWLSGSSSEGCCRLVGGPFMESHFFGEGLAIAVKAGDRRLVEVLDYALDEVEAKGKLGEIYLRWFPIGIF
jgi:polar amino acid transport system substrate-binding protein